MSLSRSDSSFGWHMAPSSGIAWLGHITMVSLMRFLRKFSRSGISICRGNGGMSNTRISEPLNHPHSR